MRIISVSEDQKFEKRIAVTPEVAKKYVNLGVELSLPENYGVHLGINDQSFKDAGVKVIKDEKELINNSDLIIQLGLLSEDKLSLVKEGQSIIGVLDPFKNKEKIDNLIKKKLTYFH